MTGNEWMFYLSLGAFIILTAGWLSVRIWIEIQKKKVKKDLQNK